MTPLTTGPSTVSIAGGPPPTVDRALGPVPHPLLTPRSTRSTPAAGEATGTRHADPVIGAAMARAFASGPSGCASRRAMRASIVHVLEGGGEAVEGRLVC